MDYHYSDSWADPGKQTLPKAWQGKSHAELVQAVFDYTRDTITAFREAGVLPDMVQIGNEITPGMLWPDGKLPENWTHFGELLKAGIRGVQEGTGTQVRPRIMIHIDKGGNREGTKQFFDKLGALGVEFDVIGQSFYPWWHGSLLDLRENLNFMATEYHKDGLIGLGPTTVIDSTGYRPSLDRRSILVEPEQTVCERSVRTTTPP